MLACPVPVVKRAASDPNFWAQKREKSKDRCVGVRLGLLLD
jgi:hypothetical protein